MSRDNGWYLKAEGYLTSEDAYQQISPMKACRSLDNGNPLTFVRMQDDLPTESVTYVTAKELQRLKQENFELRHAYAALQDAHAKLRSAMWDRANAKTIDFMTEDELRAWCAGLYDYIDELKDLVSMMYNCPMAPECEECKRLNDGYACGYIMRELGIEEEAWTKSN